MEDVELKTPLRPPKRYRKNKRKAEETKVEEFLSMDSSAYFQYDEEELEQLDSSKRASIQTEKTIDDWLAARHIFRTPITKKKEEFWEAKRERVNSISYFETEAIDFNSTEPSHLNRSRVCTSQSLSLTPGNAKISQKRTDFSNMSELKMSELSNSFPNAKCFESGSKKSKFQQLHLNATTSEHYQLRTAAKEEENDSYSEGYDGQNHQ